MKTVTTHKSKDAEWIDESGTSIPYARTTFYYPSAITNEIKQNHYKTLLKS